MSRMNGKKRYTHTPREDQCEWHRMTRMTGPDCVVMCNLINTHTHTHTHTHSSTALFVKTKRAKRAKRAKRTNTRTPRSRSECLWRMPSISPLIICQTLHCCAPSVTSAQNKRQPTSNPQNPGFNNRGLRPRN